MLFVKARVLRGLSAEQLGRRLVVDVEQFVSGGGDVGTLQSFSGVYPAQSGPGVPSAALSALPREWFFGASVA